MKEEITDELVVLERDLYRITFDKKGLERLKPEQPFPYLIYLREPSGEKIVVIGIYNYNASRITSKADLAYIREVVDQEFDINDYRDVLYTQNCQFGAGIWGRFVLTMSDSSTLDIYSRELDNDLMCQVMAFFKEDYPVRDSIKALLKSFHVEKN